MLLFLDQTTSMEEGVQKVNTISKGMSSIGIKDRSMIFNTDLVEALELDNLMQQAIVTMKSAEQKSLVVHIHMKIFLKETIKLDETHYNVAR